MVQEIAPQACKICELKRDNPRIGADTVEALHWLQYVGDFGTFTRRDTSGSAHRFYFGNAGRPNNYGFSRAEVIEHMANYKRRVANGRIVQPAPEALHPDGAGEETLEQFKERMRRQLIAEGESRNYDIIDSFLAKVDMRPRGRTIVTLQYELLTEDIGVANRWARTYAANGRNMSNNGVRPQNGVVLGVENGELTKVATSRAEIAPEVRVVGSGSEVGIGDYFRTTNRGNYHNHYMGRGGIGIIVRQYESHTGYWYVDALWLGEEADENRMNKPEAIVHRSDIEKVELVHPEVQAPLTTNPPVGTRVQTIGDGSLTGHRHYAGIGAIGIVERIGSYVRVRFESLGEAAEQHMLTTLTNPTQTIHLDDLTVQIREPQPVAAA